MSVGKVKLYLDNLREGAVGSVQNTKDGLLVTRGVRGGELPFVEIEFDLHAIRGRVADTVSNIIKYDSGSPISFEVDFLVSNREDAIAYSATILELSELL